MLLARRDFDGPAAMLDALSYLKAARAISVPAASVLHLGDPAVPA